MELQRLYYEAEEPSAFSGITNIRRVIRRKGLGISNKNLNDWLQRQSTYTLHKPARKTYKRNVVRVSGIDDQWQADLVDMRSYAKYNDGYKYILTNIDIFSKYAWGIPLKNKTGDELVNALKAIFSTNRVPYKFNTDQGTEFENRNVRSFLHNKNISFFTTRSDKKAAVVERFNRTLKNRMWKYFTYKNTYRYVDVLQHLIDGYNNTYHRSIGMAPNDVSYQNEGGVYLKLYGPPPQAGKSVKYKFNTGDAVRVSRYKRTFEKGYLPNWSEEVFTISRRYARKPPVYKIKDYEGTVIEGTFYEPELQKITQDRDATYVIEKVLARKTIRGKRHVLVKWRGYPASMNSWIPEKEVIRL